MRDLISTWRTRIYADNSVVTVLQFPFLALVLMLASLRRTRKPGRRKHKHKAPMRRFLVFMLMFASYV